MVNSTEYCAATALKKNPSVTIYVYPSVALSVIIILLNILVVAAVIKNKRLHKPAFYYVCSLAVADFIAAVVVLFSFLRNYLHGQVIREELEITQGVFVASIGASILSLLAIAFNRFFVIIHPFNYRAKMNNTVIVVVIVIIWVYSLVLGSLPIAGWNASTDDCSTIYPGLARTYVFVLSLHVILALMIILGLYIAIFAKVRKSTYIIRNASNKDERAHVKVAKTLSIVTAAFAVCWLPIMTIGLLDMAKSITLSKYSPFFTVLAVFNSLLNPIIYASRDLEMRNTFCRILCSPSKCCDRERHREPINDDSMTWLTACFTGSSIEEDRPRGGNEARGRVNNQAIPDNQLAKAIEEKPLNR